MSSNGGHPSAEVDLFCRCDDNKIQEQTFLKVYLLGCLMDCHWIQCICVFNLHSKLGILYHFDWIHGCLLWIRLVPCI